MMSPPRLRVSENRRFLVKADGSPFFYLGDTAWELFHRLTREEATRYLDDRAAKGYTVIQAVALAELDGLNTANAYGHHSLTDNDLGKPNEAYWAHVDWIVAAANERSMFVGFLPTWGDKWNKAWGAGPEIFTPQNAEAYGRWLGKRYQNAGIIWILGGDRAIETPAHLEIQRAMAKGIRDGDGGAHLITWHPSGGQGSAQYLHNEPWLDFNMRQNGHQAEFTGRYNQTREDYDRTPIKPVIDAEPIYEDHPRSFDANKQGISVAADVRRPLYWDLFTGACGHTYGHHSVWQMFAPGREPVNNPAMPWTEAILQPGAAQMQYGRWLIESRPVLTRIPDDSILVPHNVDNAVPGSGLYRFVATRDEAGTYAMVYAPVGRTFTVRMSAIKGPTAIAWWYNPRNGQVTPIGEFSTGQDRTFQTPDPGEVLDWVLVLDAKDANYPAPGTRN